MKSRIAELYGVWMSELRMVFRDPAAILIFLIVPLVYPLLYTTIYNKEVVREVPVVVVDDSHSAAGREFARLTDLSPDVRVIATAEDMARARDLVARREAYGIIHIPAGFAADIARGEQTQVEVFAEMSSILHYKAILLSATEASLVMGADIRVAETGHNSAGEDATAMRYVKGEWVSVYNIPNGFAAFFIPAVLILILQQTMLLGMATLFGTRAERRQIMLPSERMAGRRRGLQAVTLGKALCYSTLYLVISVWVLRVVPYLFGLPQIGHPGTLIVFLIPFLLSCTFFCMTLSYLSSQREFGLLLFASTSVIFIFLSGVSWPWNAMPGTLKAVAYLIPSTPGVQGFVKINTMGASLGSVMFEYVMLWIQAAFYWGAATLMHRWWVRNYDPRLNPPLSYTPME